jgi:hypothetical protein
VVGVRKGAGLAACYRIAFPEAGKEGAVGWYMRLFDVVQVKSGLLMIIKGRDP